VTRILFLAALLGSAVFVGSPTLQAQDRATFLRQAQAANDDFDAPRALRAVCMVIDFALGPLDSTWVVSVHFLTQVLIEEQQPTQAQLWARWAMRLRPDLPIDSVGFLAGVVAALREARVAAVRSGGDDFTRQTHVWPGLAATATESRFRVAQSGAAVNVLVTGVGLIGAQGLTLPPGTYELEVSANGFLPIRVTREALPGVTTEFSFALVPVVAASTVLGAEARAALARATVPLQVTRFGAPTACAAGVAGGGSRLVLTSYDAIRGADQVSANGEVRVAAWDVRANLAVLVLQAAAPDSLASVPAVADGQALWGVALADCRTPSETRTVLREWTGRPGGQLALDAVPPNIVAGSPLVDWQGRYAGTWSTGVNAAPASVVAPLIARARENVAAQRTRTPQEVAQEENHRFGSIVIAADVPGAAVRVTPLEVWQWAELAASGPAPFAFRGASGRYRVEVTAPNLPTRTQEVTVRPGETTRTVITIRTVAQGPAAAPPKKGVSKWVWIGLLGGAGAAAALAGGGGGGGGGSGGTIVISVPNP